MNWLPGWRFRQKQIINPAIGANTGYQIPVKLYYGNNIHFASNGRRMPSYGPTNYPIACYYNNRTYIVTLSQDNPLSNAHPLIRYYDHTVNEWSDEIDTCAGYTPYPLGDDDHGNPAMCIDSIGRIHIFFGAHVTYMRQRISANPEDIISNWITNSPPPTGNNATYPHPVVVGSTIYLIYRVGDANTGQEYYVKSTDNGNTWGVPVEIINMGGSIYMGVCELVGTKIHMAWSWRKNVTVDRVNVYHVYLETTDGHLYSADGTDLGTLITEVIANASCLVDESETSGKRTAQPAMHIDSTGNPHIIFIKGLGKEFTFYYTKWSGVAWSAPVPITNTGANYNYPDFIINATDDIEAYLSIGGSYGGDIERWDWDGVSWSKHSTILSQANAGGIALNHPSAVLDGQPELKLLFTQLINSPTQVITGETYAYGNNGLVGGNSSIKLNGKCRADFGDVRFTAADGTTILSYYLETISNSNYAKGLIKVNDDLSGIDPVEIYCYYGRNLVSISSLKDTMIAGDDGITGNFNEVINGNALLTHDSGNYVASGSATVADNWVSGKILSDLNINALLYPMPLCSGNYKGLVYWGLFDALNVNDMVQTEANFLLRRRFWIARRVTEQSYSNWIYLGYIDPSGSIWTFDKTNWNNLFASMELKYPLDIKLWSDGTNIYIQMIAVHNGRYEVNTSVPITSIKAFSSGICFAWGSPYTDIMYANGYCNKYAIRKYIDPHPIQDSWGIEEEGSLFVPKMMMIM
jgi:hypothetical protein